MNSEKRKLEYGEVTKIACGDMNIRVYDTKDAIDDRVIILDKDGLRRIPPRVECALTELGSSLRPVLDSLAEWGSGYKAYVAERTDNPSNS